jgi:hypothetical protein
MSKFSCPERIEISRSCYVMQEPFPKTKTIKCISEPDRSANHTINSRFLRRLKRTLNRPAGLFKI